MAKPQEDNKMRTSSIKSCTCSHKFQDKKYGKQKRVHVPTSNGWRCTVCSNNK